MSLRNWMFLGSALCALGLLASRAYALSCSAPHEEWELELVSVEALDGSAADAPLGPRAVLVGEGSFGPDDDGPRVVTLELTDTALYFDEVAP